MMEDNPDQITELLQKYTDWAVRFALAKTDEEKIQLIEELNILRLNIQSTHTPAD